jgi:hypothetical protein
MFIGAIFTLILSIGYMAFADTFSPNDPQLESEEPMLTETNDNSEQVKLNEMDGNQVERVEEAPFLVAFNDLSNESNETNNNETIKQDLEEVEVKTEPKKGDDFFQQIEKLEIEIKADKAKVEIEQERKKNRIKSEVEIEWRNEKIKLKNKKADEFLDKLFSSYEIQSAQDLQILTNQLINDYDLDPQSAEIEIKVSQKNGKKYEYKND